MIVNKNRLDKLIEIVAGSFCEDCPLHNPSEEEGGCAPEYEKYKVLIKSKHGTTSYCFDTILNWLQDFDIAEALEAGAHIVNDQVIFPPISLPNDFKLNVPCDNSGESCVSSCPWFNNCPFEDD